MPVWCFALSQVGDWGVVRYLFGALHSVRWVIGG